MKIWPSAVFPDLIPWRCHKGIIMSTSPWATLLTNSLIVKKDLDPENCVCMGTGHSASLSVMMHTWAHSLQRYQLYRSTRFVSIFSFTPPPHRFLFLWLWIEYGRILMFYWKFYTVNILTDHLAIWDPVHERYSTVSPFHLAYTTSKLKNPLHPTPKPHILTDVPRATLHINRLSTNILLYVTLEIFWLRSQKFIKMCCASSYSFLLFLPCYQKSRCCAAVC